MCHRFLLAVALMFAGLAVAAAAPAPKHRPAPAPAPAANITAEASSASANASASSSENLEEVFRRPLLPPANIFTAYPNPWSDDCYRARNHEVADLCAQWRAAEAATESVNVANNSLVVASIGAILSLMSIVLVLRALGQGRISIALARETADETKKATSHQEAQLNLARAVARAELQPYVHATRALVYLSEEEGRLPHAKVTFENSGRTPAISAEFYAFLDAGDWKAVNRYKKVARNISSNVGVIPPGQRRDREVRLTREGIRKAWAKWSELEADEPRGHFVLRGFVRYQDTFGASYVTEFCYVAPELDNDGETKLKPVHIVGPTYQPVDAKTSLCVGAPSSGSSARRKLCWTTWTLTRKFVN